MRLFAELLPDMERVPGRDHPNTLRTRDNIAAWTGEVGDAREALRLSRAAAGPGAGAGPRPPHTLGMRKTSPTHRRGGDLREALGRFTELLLDTERVPGRDHQHAPDPRQHRPLDREVGERVSVAAVRRVAAGHGAGAGPRPPQHAQDPRQHRGLDRRVGDAREALRLFAELLPDLERCWAATTQHAHDPPQHRGLDRRGGRRREALRRPAPAAGHGAGAGPRPPRHAQDPRQHRGLDRRGGDAREASRLFAEPPPDQERVRRGREPPRHARTRNKIAGWTGRVGERRGVAAFADAAGHERGPGRDHPDTLRVKVEIKLLQSAAPLRKGRARRAIRLTDPAVGVLVEMPPMIGRVGPMQRRSVMGGRRGPARSAGRPGPCRDRSSGKGVRNEWHSVKLNTLGFKVLRRKTDCTQTNT